MKQKPNEIKPGEIRHESNANCRVKIMKKSFIGGWWTVREVDKLGRCRGTEWECPATSLIETP